MKVWFLSLALVLGLILPLWSQGHSYFSSLFFYDQSQPNSSTREPNGLSVPFRFPQEMQWYGMGFPHGGNLTSNSSSSSSRVEELPVAATVGRNPYSSFDPVHRIGLSTGLVHAPLAGATYRNLNLELGLVGSFALNHGASGFMDTLEPRIRLKYRVQKNFFSLWRDSRMEFFLQLSELQRFEGNPSSQLGRNSDSKPGLANRQIYATPGLSLSGNGLVFEGMVQVPMNTREANRTLDELWSPEVRGNLGLKYIFPVSETKK